MNLTLHLVAKDVRRLRPALVLWVGLLVSQVVVSYRMVSNIQDNLNRFQRTGDSRGLLLVLALMVTYLLIGMLVLEDPVAGGKMFWVTRPIKGGRLLLAKVIAAAIFFGAFPLAVWMPWWVLCDFSFRDMCDAASNIAFWQLLVAIPAFVVASLATNVARFLLMSVLLAMGTFVTVINFADIGPTEVSFALRSTRIVVAILILGIAGVIGTVLMYRTRRMGRVIIVLAVGLSLACLAKMKFPMELSFPSFRKGEVLPLENSVQIAVEIGTTRLEHVRNKEGTFDCYLVVQLKVLNLPDERGLNAGRADVTLQWPDGTIIQSSSGPISSVRNDERPVYRAFGLTRRYAPLEFWDSETQAKYDRARDKMSELLAREGRFYHRRDPVKANDRSVSVVASILISNQIAAKIVKEPPQYRMTIKVETSLPEVLGEIAPVPGSVIIRHGRIELLRFRQEREHQPKNSNERGLQTVNGAFSVLQGPIHRDRVLFYYIDRQHERVVPMPTRLIESIAPITERIAWVDFNFPVPQVWRIDRWIEIPEWRKDLKIGMVIFKPAGTFERSLTGEHLSVVTREESD